MITHSTSTSPLKATLMLLFMVTWLASCSSREHPAPVTELYQGKDYRDFSKDSFDGDKYIVQKGDTLFSIAWFSGHDYRDIARRNRISAPYSIYPGQQLTLSADPVRQPRVASSPPGQTSKINTKQTVDRSQKQAYGKSYTVVKNQHKRSESDAFPKQISRWVWPAKGRLTTEFSLSEQGSKGIEISGKKGDSVLAAADGKVVYTGNALRGYGQLVIIKHSNDFLSAYAHNQKILVSEQQWIEVGQEIALMGDSGTDKVKLRFEVRYRGKSVDPMRYLPKQK